MTINTENLVDDFISNLKKIFDDNMKSLGLKEVFKNDILLIPTTPSLALSCTSMWSDQRTIGKTHVRYTFNFIGTLWYYHGEVNPDIDRNIVMRHAYKIAHHIIQNSSLNGWLTNERADVRACAYSPRARSGMLLASARIMIVAPYLAQINITG